MKEVGKQLFISREELLGFNVSENTINSWRKSNKIKRQQIDAKLYFQYSSLPPITLNKLPSQSQLKDLARIEAFEGKQVKKELTKEARVEQLKQLPVQIELQYSTYFTRHLGYFTGKVDQQAAVQLAKKAEMILFMLRLEAEHKKKTLFDAHKLINDAPFYLKNYFNFAPALDKFREAQAQGELYTKLLPKNLGKKNALKISKDNLLGKQLIKWYGEPTKPSARAVFRMYEQNKKADWPKIEVRAIQLFLQRPEIKTLWYQNRHGLAATREFMEPTLKRKKTTRPGAVWWADGTALQLIFVNEKNKLSKALYVYLVADSYSEAIIGYALGFTEESPLVTNALKKAVTRYGYLPEYLGYDNSTANRSVQVQDLMTKMSRVHFPCEPYNGRAKKIEGFIRILEQGYLRYHPFFKGGNITTKSLNSKANPEFLIELHSSGQLPDMAGVIQAFEDSIKAYNEDKYGKKYSRLEKYLDPLEGRKKASPLDYCSLFMSKRREPVKYTNKGLTLEISGEKHTYQVLDSNGEFDFNFYSQYLEQRFEVHVDNDELSLIALYKNDIFINFAAKKEEFSESPIGQPEGERAKLIKTLKDRKAYLDERHKAYQHITAETQAEAIPEMGFKAFFKDVFNDKEEQIQNEQLGLVAFQEEENPEDAWSKLLNQKFK